MDHMRIFGCLCYAKTINRSHDKFASRSRKCVFIGYPFGKKGWRLYDLDTGTYFDSRDVVFMEENFPYQSIHLHDTDSHEFLNETSTLDDVLVVNQSTMISSESTPSTQSSTETPSVSTETPSSSTETPIAPTTEPTSTPDVSTEPNTHTVPPNPDTMGRGHRTKFPNSNLKDFVVKTTRPSTHVLTATSPVSGTRYPIANYVNCDRFAPHHQVFLSAVTKSHEPRSFNEAMQDENWKTAMQLEISALEKNNTWTLEDLPPNKKAIGSK
ncbi:uncharacterized protein LOC141614672 [Silene latifolia]|uniref:uncharacterized protein LOC141614672 n=1 Tax=Silene latifolia TaxID=37657 RepID=UPI003D77FFAA